MKDDMHSAEGAASPGTLERRYRAVFDHPTEFTAVMEAVRNPAGVIVEWRYCDANRNFLDLLELTRETLLGGTLTEVLPAQADQLSILGARVLQERAPHRYEATIGARQYSICLFPVDDNTIVSSGIDITARVESARDLRERSDADRAEKEWLSAVLNSITEEVYFTDTDRRYTYANPAAMREFSHSAVSGIPIEDIVSRLEVLRADGSPRPLSEAPPLRALAGEVVIDEEQLVRIPRTGELRHRQVSSAPVRDAQGNIIGAVSVVRDITERKRLEVELRARERRFGTLLALSDRFRDLTDPAEVAQAAVRLLSETLDVSCCGYSAIDPVSLLQSGDSEWFCRNDHNTMRALRIDQYGPAPDQLHRGHAIVCNDTQADLRTRARSTTLADHGVRSFVLFPVTEQSQAVAVLYLAHDSTRQWTDDELVMIREVAERTHGAVERRRNERAAAADLRDARLLHELAARQIAESDEATLFDETLAAAMTITQADSGAIQLLDEHSQRFSFAAMRGLPAELTAPFQNVNAASASPCGIVLATGQRALLDFEVDEASDSDGTLRLYFQHGLRSGQAMPLTSRSGRLLGVLSTHWKHKRVNLSAREVRFLDLLGRQAADLIARLRVEHNLRASEQQLREGAQRKDEFLAVLAHELRNPLAALSAASALLTRAEQKPEVVTMARDALQRQIQHMARLLDDLLDMARIANGIIQLRMAPLDLNDVLRAACETVRPQLDNRQHTLRVTLSDTTTYVHGDAVRLSQIIANLLTNSAKYTPNGGVIEVSLANVQDCAVITVRDNGRGIDPDLLPRIFEMFAQELRPHEASGGLGIGLALARGLAQLHGGRIDVASPGKGQGSTFTVSLPLLISLSDQITAIGKAELPPLRPIRILVADDNREIAMSWSVLLEQCGHTVATAFDGESALAEAERVRPDAALLDIGMPKLDGYAVANAIRGSDWGSRTLLVAVTGWAQASDRERARAAGFDHHLAKPASFDDIMHVLSKA
jgi:PAS domain S-box-containing protein